MTDRPEMRFALESTLGKLTRWLRILGFDSVYIPGEPDDSIFSFAREGRIILTRTRKIRENNPGRKLLFVSSDHPVDQLKQVVSDLNIHFSDIHPFSRCIRCNCPLEAVEKENVRGRVPDYVYETQNRFRICPHCLRIYWQGTHHERSMNFIRRLFPEARRRCCQE